MNFVQIKIKSSSCRCLAALSFVGRSPLNSYDCLATNGSPTVCFAFSVGFPWILSFSVFNKGRESGALQQIFLMSRNPARMLYF